MSTEAKPAEATTEVKTESKLVITSDVPVSQKLTDFFDAQLADTHNKFCIDCKTKESTHFLVWLSCYTCKDCAEQHRTAVGGNNKCYVKELFNEHWDDYQLKSA